MKTSMPARTRTYEKTMQMVFGAVIALVLMQALVTVVIQIVEHLIFS